ncbi:MAG: dihydrolipoyllysine-residue acetyltransferase [Methylotenera sp.]|jgi:pyruvate dehydrogenase E2 component (dihydrolipoamide acetyltransferase)|uniref:Acetyltransferase component of pyruvate dehydrogenase complex n=1 Tax=Methylotenera mobilis TaxID=359408 RepID=A0A351R9A5_9PROT|nr:dihydrolipoyllysine-residue acetyltransferase [Methylotenera sp.]MDP3211267.1 dihydrolipoyllysine-residue acetyltransferase [Methylotenera sp.]MDP3775942.1 dihydrolipoyllysine-residue acetyltransferase [Methylotenera sp.]PPD00890.1 MAG: dihydrolipoyllysine-residue acetyltransferase [Methylotenera sp.]HBA08626.1 dihydrolipoyllysine-residue acetyltransferase [Methylotenera mobilis]
MAVQDIFVPDIGNFDSVDVIEVLIKAGDVIAKDDSLITVESDKASMDIPAPFAGVVKEVKIKVGDKAAQGTLLMTMDVTETVAAPVIEAKPTAVAVEEAPQVAIPEPTRPAPEPPKPVQPTQQPAPVGESAVVVSGKLSHASPSIRKFARELGVNLALVTGSGAKNRILQSDVQSYVKGELAKPRTENMGAGVSGLAALPMPVIDFSKFGAVETKPLSRIKKLSGANLHRNWVTAPHVTQFDEADITDLEDFRKSMQADAEKRGVKLTMLAFLIKASVNALKAYPNFNASLSPDGDNLILKNYFNIGFACDTPDGLVVPVVRDVHQKDVLDIARDLMDLSAKARERKLKVEEMQGGCFTISSLGGIGGTMFTPIINCPEVAILGVSRSSMQPVYNKDTNGFEPRLILPMSLSYDHRVIDGADGARFTSHMRMMLSDVRRLLL